MILFVVSRQQLSFQTPLRFHTLLQVNLQADAVKCEKNVHDFGHLVYERDVLEGD